MDKKTIKMLATHKEYKEGEQYEIDAATATKWLAAELCEEVQDEANVLAETVTKIVNERVEKAVEEALAQVETKLAKNVKPNVTVNVKPEAKSKTEFIRSVVKVQSPTRYSDDERNAARKILGEKYGSKVLREGNNGAGGYTVPEEWGSELIRIEGYQSLAGIVRHVTMNSDVFYLPTLDQAGTAAAAGGTAFLGGASVGWVAESSAPAAETNPAFGQLVYNAYNLRAYTEVTHQLLDDSNQDMGGLVMDILKEACNQRLSYEVLNGANSSSPEGIIDFAATIPVARTTANQFKLADAANMFSRLTPGSHARAVWVIHPYHLAYLLQFESANGAVAWLPSLNGTPTMSLFGCRVITSEFTSAVGTGGDVVLFDPQAYTIADRKQVAISVSEHVKFYEDRVGFKVIWRGDGQPVIRGTINLQDETSEVSPYVQLDDAAS